MLLNGGVLGELQTTRMGGDVRHPLIHALVPRIFGTAGPKTLKLKIFGGLVHLTNWSATTQLK